MTPLAALLEACYVAGIRLCLAPGNSVTIDAPEGSLTDELLVRLQEGKPALLTLLKQEAETRRLVDRLFKQERGHLFDEAAWLAGSPIYLLPSGKTRRMP